MTMPHLMNCSHSPDGWCLDCVGNLQAENEALDTELSTLQDSVEFVIEHLRQNGGELRNRIADQLVFAITTTSRGKKTNE